VLNGQLEREREREREREKINFHKWFTTMWVIFGTGEVELSRETAATSESECDKSQKFWEPNFLKLLI
jgi:hypothetical protein